MKKRTLIATSIVAALALAGCSSNPVSVLPQANNQYQLVAQGSSSTDALNSAMDKAHDICKKTKQKVVVASSNVTHQGMSQDTAQLLQMATTAINMNTNTYVAGPDTSQDYTATVMMQCQ